VRGAVIVVAFELIYLIGVNLALNSDGLRSLINRRPERTLVEWSSARSYFPGFFRIDDLKVRGQNRGSQFSVTVDEGRIWVSLAPLVFRRVDVRWYHGKGMEFLLRRRPRPDAEPKHTEHYPMIPGLEELPWKPPARRRPPWTVRVRNVTIESLRDLWINRSRLTGDGRLTADLKLKVRGPMEVGSFSLVMPAAQLYFDSEPVGQDVDLDIRGKMDRFVYKENKGRSLLGFLSGDMRLEGTLFEVGWFDEAVGKISGFEFGGAAETRAHIRLQRGLVMPGSEFLLDSPAFDVRFLDYAVRGPATVSFDVQDAGGTPRSNFVASLGEIEVFKAGRDDVSMLGTGLDLRSVSEQPDLAGGFPIFELAFDMPYVEVPDVSVFNDTLPPYLGLEFLSGGAVLSTHFEILEDRRARGTFGMLGEAITAEALEETYQGSLELDVSYETDDLTGSAFNLANTRLQIDDIVLPGLKKSKGNGWWTHIRIDNGAIDLSDAFDIDATIGFQMRDIRPLIVLLKETKEEGPGWFWLIPNVKNVDGEATVRLGPQLLDLEELAITGKGTEILAEMNMSDAGTDGILFARYKLFSAGIDFRGEKRKWRMSKPRRWYEAAAAGLDEADEEETPEGSDPPDDGDGGGKE